MDLPQLLQLGTKLLRSIQADLGKRRVHGARRAQHIVPRGVRLRPMVNIVNRTPKLLRSADNVHGGHLVLPPQVNSAPHCRKRGLDVHH